MEKTALIFPGIGYHIDKPLLYYGKKLAREAGYRILEVPYGGFPDGVKGNPEKMKKAWESAMDQTEKLLKKEKLDGQTDLLFLSKSIGTVVAAWYQEKHQLSGRHIYFTPVEATFRYAREGSGIVFHGTADPWVSTEVVKEACERLKLPLYITEGANHSLETGSARQDLSNLQTVMELCHSFIGNLIAETV